ncbi:tetratricopeptide repeat protein, partial [Flavobacteriales bacterium]|nr:tetratricopeptide repeat protein [Flavobacteriales bacterium]MDB4710754.1 tetratricopeptide repeat protein [Flavobacteriales bacterium]
SGKLHGLFKGWHQNGILKYQCEFVDGLQQGEIITYDDKGIKVKSSVIVDGNYEGIQTTFHPNGVKASEVLMKDHERNGVYKEWNEKGDLIEEVEFVDGERNESYTTQKTNPPQDSESFIGKDEGNEQKEWYENGQFKLERNYKNGELHGPYKEWHENGQLKLERNYKNGEQNGVFKLWNISGQLLLECNFKDGRENGFEKKWNKKGDLIREVVYDNGEIVEILKTLSDGHFIYNDLACRQIDCGKYEEAKLNSQRAIELAPRPGYYDTAGMAYYKSGDLTVALLLLNKAIELDVNLDHPCVSEHLTNRGLVHMELRNTDEAKNDFTKALEKNPDYTPAKKKLDEIDRIGVFNYYWKSDGKGETEIEIYEGIDMAFNWFIKNNPKLRPFKGEKIMKIWYDFITWIHVNKNFEDQRHYGFNDDFSQIVELLNITITDLMKSAIDEASGWYAKYYPNYVSSIVDEHEDEICLECDGMGDEDCQECEGDATSEYELLEDLEDSICRQVDVSSFKKLIDFKIQ